jgi:dTMP kinase
MRAGFLSLAQEFPDRFVVIDGSGPIDSVAADIFSQIQARIAQTGRTGADPHACSAQ